jgi:hypothetical protein
METIVILALIGIMVTYGVIHYFKYKRLKRYYKRQVDKNIKLLDTIVELNERITVLSKKTR